MQPLTSHQSGEDAFILIFERIFHQEPVEVLLDIAKECEDLVITAEVERMFRGVEANRSIIDDTIEANLKKWTMSRLPKVTLAILRLGVWEILFEDGVPDDIVVSECVRLATDYAFDDVAFINGLLGTVVRSKAKKD